MFEVHGSGTVMRNMPQEVPQVRATLALCTITGAVQRADGSLIPNGVITFDPRVPQSLSGTTIQPLMVSAITDAYGDLQAITLMQGLYVQIVVSDNGITYPPMSAMIPYVATATFSQILMSGLALSPGPGPEPPGPGPGPGQFPTSPPVWLWSGTSQTWQTMPTTAGLWAWSAASQHWVLI